MGLLDALKIFGGASKGSSDQRMDENWQRLQQQQQQNNDILQRAQLQSQDAWNRTSAQSGDALNRAGLDMERKRFQQSEPDTQARQAMIGSMLQRIQPMQMTGLSERVQGRMPKMNSLIDALGPEAREAGGLLSQRGLSGLQSGPTQFDELPPLNLPPELNIPPAMIMALKKSGLLDKIFGGAGLLGNVLSAFKGGGGDSRSVGTPPFIGRQLDGTQPSAFGVGSNNGYWDLKEGVQQNPP